MTGLTTEILLEAYRCGVFPMADSRESEELFWVEPKLRGVIPLKGFHVPKSLARLIKAEKFRVTIDRAFEKVIRLCGSDQAGRGETWINDEIVALYTALFEEGNAHSIEVWEGGRLVGGLYGVSIGAAFFGESKFHLERDASKVALAYTVARLKSGGYTLFDVQFVTEHLERFGAVEIPKEEYLLNLKKALAENGDFYLLPEESSGAVVLQSIAQTS